MTQVKKKKDGRGKFSKDFFRKIGSKGGKRTSKILGTKYMSEIGRRGGQISKKSLELVDKQPSVSQ